MWTSALVGATAMFIVSSSSSFGQPTQGDVAGGAVAAAQQERNEGPDRRLASRLSWLKESLRLSPDQEKYWTAYEAAVQNLTRYRRTRMDARDGQSTADPTQRLRERARAMSNASAALTGVADAQAPLYNSLDQDQKRRFSELTPAPGEIRMQRPRSDDEERRSSGGRERDMDQGWRGRD